MLYQYTVRATPRCRRGGGPPHVTPVWFGFDATDASWWISTGAQSVKIRNIGTDPEVSLALVDAFAPWWPKASRGFTDSRSHPG